MRQCRIQRRRGASTEIGGTCEARTDGTETGESEQDLHSAGDKLTRLRVRMAPSVQSSQRSTRSALLCSFVPPLLPPS